MPVSRMRMRQWLEDRLESKAIAGLVWLDKEMKIFSIPWKHAARHGWEMEKDACLFKQWAIHTGKFKAGVSHPDPKTWKANFRCALNSLPDIIEVKDKSVNKGCGAVRVYRMLQNDSKKGKRSKTKVGKPKSRCKASDLNEEVPNWSEGSLSPDPSTLSPQNVESMAEVGNSKLSELEVSSSQYSTDEESQANSNCVVRDRIDSCSLFQWSPGHPADFDDEIPIELFATAEELERDPLQWIPIDIFSNRSSLQSNVVDTTDTSDSLLDNGSHTSGLEIEARFYPELRGLTGSEDSLGLFEPWPVSSLLHHIG